MSATFLSRSENTVKFLEIKYLLSSSLLEPVSELPSALLIKYEPFA